MSYSLKNGDVFSNDTTVEIDALPPSEKTLILNLGNIGFKYGQVFLDKSSILKIKEAARTLKKYQGSKVQVRGFAIKGITSTQGQCIEKSIERAKKVADLLLKEGVPANQLEMLGYGNEAFGPTPAEDMVEMWLFSAK